VAKDGTAPVETRIATIEDILGADDLQEDFVDVPEWGGPGTRVRVRGFNKQEQLDIREEAGGAENFDVRKFELLVFIHGVIEPKFTVEQLELLKTKNAMVVDRVIERVMDIAGMTEEARKRAKTTFPEGPKPKV
jgi:hypothetical protein